MPESEDGKSTETDKEIPTTPPKQNPNEDSRRENLRKLQKARWDHIKELEAKEKAEKEKEKSTSTASFSGVPAPQKEPEPPKEKPKNDDFAIAMVAISLVVAVGIGIWLISKYLNNKDEQEYEQEME